jgi:hypothetical protein
VTGWLVARAAGQPVTQIPARKEFTMITNQQLREAFLSPQMKYYFDKKLAPLTSGEIDARIEELLKYLNMSIHADGDIPFSKEIDEVWHYWVLETAEYALLCSRLHGGGFIHHSSNDYAEYTEADAKSRRIDLSRGLAILSAYVLNYGPFEADRVVHWPLAERLMERLGMDLPAFNAWLASVHSAPAAMPAQSVAALAQAA